jgi:two-component system sensor histidine kinase UhpB
MYGRGPVEPSRRWRHPVDVTLFWRVFVINAGVLVLATLALALSPATVSWPLRVVEAVVLAAGVAVLIALNVLLLRRTFAPLERLTGLMRRIDPMAPGQRIATVAASPEVCELGRAFDEMLDRLERERRESSARALAAMEGERLRIARELHDEIGQTLTALVLELEALVRQSPPALGERLAEVRETTRASVEEVREIAHRLRPEALEDFGLRAALATLGASFAERTELRVRSRLASELPELERERELAIYRVAQESLTNVARHAGARSVELELERRDGMVVLRVRDDGLGVDQAAIPALAHGPGSGIRGMRERALLIGGRLEIGRASPHGTEVRLTVPVEGV